MARRSDSWSTLSVRATAANVAETAQTESAPFVHCRQVGKLQRSKTKGITDARGVLTVNVIRAKGLEVSILLFLLLEKQSDFWQQS